MQNYICLEFLGVMLLTRFILLLHFIKGILTKEIM
jgi:hypothetical protein